MTTHLWRKILCSRHVNRGKGSVRTIVATGTDGQIKLGVKCEKFNEHHKIGSESNGPLKGHETTKKKGGKERNGRSGKTEKR